MVSLYLIVFLSVNFSSLLLSPKMFLVSTTSLGKVHDEPLPLACFEPVIHDLWCLLLLIYTCTWSQTYPFPLCPWKTQIFQRRAPDLCSGGCDFQSALGTQLWLNIIGSWLQTLLNLFWKSCIEDPKSVFKTSGFHKSFWELSSLHICFLSN